MVRFLFVLLLAALFLLTFFHCLSISFLCLRENKRRTFELKVTFFRIFPVCFSSFCADGSAESQNKGANSPGTDTPKQPYSKPGLNYLFARRLRWLKMGKLFQRFSRWDKLCIKLHYGFEDAALTGMSAGAIWAVGGVLQSIISTTLRFEEGFPSLVIEPSFPGKSPWVSFNLKFRLRFYHAVYLILLFLFFILPTRSEIKRWMNIRSRTL